MTAASSFVLELYALDTVGFTDAHFERLEDVVVAAVHLLERSPAAEARRLIDRLNVALEGIQEGLPPDPAKRPTREELAADFATRLRDLGF